jgi:hypothetical protein
MSWYFVEHTAQSRIKTLHEVKAQINLGAESRQVATPPRHSLLAKLMRLLRTAYRQPRLTRSVQRPLDRRNA